MHKLTYCSDFFSVMNASKLVVTIIFQ